MICRRFYTFIQFFLPKIETFYAKVIGDGLFRVNHLKVLIQWRQLNLVPRFPLHFSAEVSIQCTRGGGRALAVGGGEVVLLFSDSDKTLRIKYVFSMFCFPICYLSNQRAEEQHSKQLFPYQHQLSHINCNLSPYGNIQLDTTIIKWTVKNSAGRYIKE